MDPKRFLIGIIAIAAFAFFLNTMGLLSPAVETVARYLPGGTQTQQPVDAAPDITEPLVDAGLINPDTQTVAGTSAVAMLDSIRAKTDAPRTPYDRTEHFGSGWSDSDRNGCDQRNDTLFRDLTSVTFKPGTRDCVVITGVLDDPFTGEIINFVKADASKVQIDHMVPLSWAWEHGASTWTFEDRRAFANDSENLTAVSGSANGSKSDKGPADWLPSNSSYLCEYTTRFVFVVHTWELTIGESDRLAARRILADCA